MARIIHTHPAELVLIYDWQGGEFALRLGAVLCPSREDFARAIEAGNRIVCYDAEAAEGTRGAKTTGFDWFCSVVFELCRHTAGRKLVVIDEVQDLIDPWNIPEPLDDILGRGGRAMVDTCIAGQAANALQSAARNQVTELYIFRCIDGNALKYPVSVGLDAVEVQALPDTVCIHKDMRTGEKMRLELWGRKSKAG